MSVVLLVLGALAAVVLLRLSPAPDELTAYHAEQAALPADWPTQMLAAVNKVRAEAGLKKVTLCGPLSAAAQRMTDDMASNDYFSHTSPDGRDLWQRLGDVGVKGRAAAENLAAGHDSVKDAMAAWLSSPEHRANMLNPSMRRAGFGFSQSPDSTYGTYWAQDFSVKSACRG